MHKTALLHYQCATLDKKHLQERIVTKAELTLKSANQELAKMAELCDSNEKQVESAHAEQEAKEIKDAVNQRAHKMEQRIQTLHTKMELQTRLEALKVENNKVLVEIDDEKRRINRLLSLRDCLRIALLNEKYELAHTAKEAPPWMLSLHEH